MARSAPIAPPPRLKLAEAETPAQAPAPNIETSDDDAKQHYINVRVSRQDFINIKTAALIENMKLGPYILHIHRAYQANKG
jgi:predicted DNA binding CopG/RHH family protein